MLSDGQQNQHHVHRLARLASEPWGHLYSIPSICKRLNAQPVGFNGKTNTNIQYLGAGLSYHYMTLQHHNSQQQNLVKILYIVL